MDLNFIDPPIPGDVRPFEPRITADAAPEALAQAAEQMRTNEVLTTAFSHDWIEEAAAPLSDPRVAATYASGVPMVARFLTIELETEHKIEKGIGRMRRRESPPRFGEKYRKKLRDEATGDEIRATVEDLVFYGFAAGAVVNGMANEPKPLRESDLTERWKTLVRNLHPTWYAVIDRLNMDQSAPDPIGLLIFGVMQPAGDTYALLAEHLGLGHGRPFGKARAVTYMHFFLALGWLVFDTGTESAQPL